jgi:hypothetical protein
MKTYCVKCKKNTDTNNEREIILKNGRKAMTGVCNICGTKKFKFIK